MRVKAYTGSAQDPIGPRSIEPPPARDYSSFEAYRIAQRRDQRVVFPECEGRAQLCGHTRNSSRLEANRWIKAPAVTPAYAAMASSVSSAGPTRYITRTMAANTSVSSALRRRGLIAAPLTETKALFSFKQLTSMP